MENKYVGPTGGRLIVGCASLFGVITCIAIFIYGASAGINFVPTLITFFVFALCVTHARYAFGQNLTHRQVRKIDYWYLGAAAVGMFMFAVAYSEQRDAAVVRSKDFVFRQGELAFLSEIKAKLDLYLEEVCKDEFRKVTERPCITGKSLKEDVKPGASREWVKQWMGRLAIARTEASRRLTVNSEEAFVNAHIALGVQLLKLRDYINLNTQEAHSLPVDESMRLMFSIGQLIIWPFLLAFALALRIAKVTIDVFEWSK